MVLSNTNEGASLHEVCRDSPFSRRNYGILIADLSVLRFGRLKRNLRNFSIQGNSLRRIGWIS